MKLNTRLTALAALMAGMGAMAPAYGADVYTGESYKDAPAIQQSAALWTGWAITGQIGHATQNYETKRRIDSEGGFYREDTRGADGITEGDLKTPGKKAYCEDSGATIYQGKCWKEGKRGWYEVSGYNPPVAPVYHGAEAAEDDTETPIRYDTVLAIANFIGAQEFDASGLQGGLELSRRNQYGGWVFEAAIGGNLDGAGSASETYNTLSNVTIDPNGLFGDPYPVDEDDFALTGRASLSVEKQYDVYAMFRAGHVFGSEGRLLLGAGIGPVLGRFKVKGAHDFDIDTDGLASTGFDSDETAFGLGVEAFAKYKLDRNWDFGVKGRYVNFAEIDASDSASVDFPYGDSGKGLYANVSDKATIDADEWSVLGTVTYTFAD